MKSAVENVLSFDVEHWHSATLVRDAVTDPEDHIEDSVEIVLDLLADHDVRATFFVVGEIARTHPISSHGSLRRATKSAPTATRTGRCSNSLRRSLRPNSPGRRRRSATPLGRRPSAFARRISP